MHVLSFQFLVLLSIVLFAGDRAICAAVSREVIRTLCYGALALLALIAIIVSFV